MNDKDFEFLLKLYETKNITKAAESLYVSQPSLTYRIKQIEKELQSPIIVRGAKGIEFTNAGQLLLDYVKNQQHTYELFQNALQQLDNEVSGTLKIGASGMYARYALPSLLATFKQHYPKIAINLMTGWSKEINKLLLNEEVHIGIVRGEYNPTGERILLQREKIYIVATEPIDFDKLPSLPAIAYDTDASLKTTIEQWWTTHFTVPQNIAIYTDRSDTCREMALNGLGYAILPEICLEDCDFYKVPLVDEAGDPIYRDTWLAYPKYLLELSQVDMFIHFLADAKK